MPFFCFFIVSLFTVLAQTDSEELVTLNEANFEHLTQVATGATTGDWFVLFHKGEAECCKSLISAWNSLASQVSASGDLQLSIAKVDGLSNPLIVQRFNQSLPSTVYFRLGRMYQIPPSSDTQYLFDLIRESKYKSFPSRPVPKQLTFLSDFSLDKLATFPFNLALLLLVLLSALIAYYTLGSPNPNRTKIN